MLVSTEPDTQSVEDALNLADVQALSRSCVLPVYPRNPNFLRLRFTVHKATCLAKEAILQWKPDIIYIYGIYSFRSALYLAKQVGARVVYDALGFHLDESLMEKGRWNLIAYYHHFKQLEVCRKADLLSTVSDRFRIYLEHKTKRQDIFVVPCCVNETHYGYRPEARLRIRQLLNWSPEIPVVVYCGGMSVWQRIKDILQLMVEMKSLEPSLKFLLLTPNADNMKELASNSGLATSDYYCGSVSRADIPDWLSVADAGIILRHDVPTNNYASPVKIAEYLACGVPVICSRGIGDYSDMVQEEHVGIVVSDGQPDIANRAVELVTQAHRDERIRQQAQALVHKALTWSAYIDCYRANYH